ncbi:MAG: PhoX family phosphatase [Gammaproteobacteria bacterium]|nr:PhoX family phosphatase [Gammaproteobacteria bacterium]
MSHDEEISNRSENRPFEDILRQYVERRTVLKGGLATAVASMSGFSGLAFADDDDDDDDDEGVGRRRRSRLMNFEPVKVADGNGAVPVISEDYEYQVLIPWGDPIVPSGPAYSYPPSAEDQKYQIGIGHDGMTYFPMSRRGDDDDDDEDGRRRGSNRHGMLAINHEFGRNSTILDRGVARNGADNQPLSLEDVRASQHAHGVSVVEIKKIRGKWQTVESQRARRIHVNTPVTFSGPVAGNPLLQTPAGNAPLGTVNNCSNGHTPWGTYLTCEENFNGYFGANDPSWAPTPEQDRYGFSAGGFGYGWQTFDDRFDLSNASYMNEENRFGWVVEIDPMNPDQTPVKRTAMGRFKHEGVALAVGRGKRVVAYMGDDQRFDYIYKFVSAGNWKRMRRQGKSPLDEGTLYVARFDADGTGEWLELSMNNPALAFFGSDANILTYARLAADTVGATPMDRPEWTTVAPDGSVYCTLTNNSLRTVADAANPLAPNADGHIVRWKDSKRFTGTTFEWDIFILAKDTHSTEESFSDPDGLYADPDGRLFIQTDGGQKDGLNNQLVIADTKTKEIRRLFTGVTGDEITGVTMTPDRRTLFINTQHPGNGDPALTNFPAPTDGATRPRDCTFVIRRKNGGIIGS